MSNLFAVVRYLIETHQGSQQLQLLAQVGCQRPKSFGIEIRVLNRVARNLRPASRIRSNTSIKMKESTKMNTNNLQPIPYLLFNGNCAEAMDFYADALGGKIVVKMSLADLPGSGFSGPEAEAHMCHVRLEMPGGGHLYAGDFQKGLPPIDLSAVHVAINLATADEGEKVFNALSQGGIVEMEYQPSIWSEKFGMLKDKYGVSWMVNGNLQDI